MNVSITIIWLGLSDCLRRKTRFVHNEKYKEYIPDVKYFNICYRTTFTDLNARRAKLVNLIITSLPLGRLNTPTLTKICRLQSLVILSFCSKSNICPENTSWELGVADCVWQSSWQIWTIFTANKNLPAPHISPLITPMTVNYIFMSSQTNFNDGKSLPEPGLELEPISWYNL